jgi:FkbM family methyltransferase
VGLARSLRRQLDRLLNHAYARLALGIPRRRLSGLAVKSVDGYRIAHRPGTADDEVLEHSFDRDIFFTAVPDYQPKPGDVVLDVGAHLGDFSLLAASRVSPGPVYAVEPCAATFDLLALNLELNDCRNVVACRLALGERDGTCTLYHSPPGEDWGNSTTHDHAGTHEVAPCRSLASFFAEHGIDRVDFAKLNCEGGEFQIILAAPLELLRRVGIWLVLYHCDFATGHSEQELLAHLEAAGFATVIHQREADRGWIIARQKTGRRASGRAKPWTPPGNSASTA